MTKTTRGSKYEKNFVSANYIGMLADASSNMEFEMLEYLMRDEEKDIYTRLIQPHVEKFKNVRRVEKDAMLRRDKMTDIVFPGFKVDPSVREHWAEQIQKDRRTNAKASKNRRQA